MKPAKARIEMRTTIRPARPLSKSSRRANGKKKTVLRDETSPSTASRPAMNDSTAATAPIRQPAVLAALSALISRTEASAPMHETASDAINSVMLSIVYAPFCFLGQALGHSGNVDDRTVFDRA